LDARDREFLREYTQFSGLNHIVTAVALYNAGRHADGTAARLIQEVDLLGAKEAADSAGHLNEGARVQTVVVGRLVLELVAAIEDVAGLAWAIRERKAGLLSRYMWSSVGEAAMLLDRACQDPRPDLTELLRLPPIAAIKASLDERAARAIELDYTSMPSRFAQMGDLYRRRIFESVTSTALNDQPPEDSLYVVLDLLDDSTRVPSPKGTFVDAYNKLKHRFTVVEKLSELGPGIRYAHFGRDPRSVRDLYDQVIFVSKIGLELAHILAAIADAGLDEPAEATA
jgi:hypothetical protein